MDVYPNLHLRWSPAGNWSAQHPAARSRHPVAIGWRCLDDVLEQVLEDVE